MLSVDGAEAVDGGVGAGTGIGIGAETGSTFGVAIAKLVDGSGCENIGKVV